MGRNFIEYASYVIIDRAIPDILDGLKPVQRRILATLSKMDDGKFHKVANVIGDTMKLHPHGDASIGDALVVLANKDYFIEKQGNFGNPITGHAPAAARYIECRLTDLAKETLFRKALTEYRPSYDGRNEEPVALPAKLPVLLMLGAEGIAVGMSTRILPYNLPELLQAQIKILQNEPFEIFPDFPTGGIVDVTDYDDGHGKVKVRARLEKRDEKTVVVREIAFGTTTESLIASIESAAQKGKVKIGAINDFTTDRVEIEIELSRGVYANEVIPQLYAHTDCEVSLTSNMVMIKDRRPVEMGVSEVLCFLTDQLRELIKAELQHELGQLTDRKHWLDLERIFIENRVYKRIEKAKTAKTVVSAVRKGLGPFVEQLDREITDDDIDGLLKIPIRRISQYDIDKNRTDLETTVKAIKGVRGKLRKLTPTTIEIGSFEAVDVRAVARQNIKVAYDPESGFFGSDVKGSKYQFTVSEYDRILIVSRDGSFRIVGPEQKVLVPDKAIHAEVFDQEQGAGFTVVYRDKDKIAWGKKIHIRAFIRDREYELIKGKSGRVDYLIPGNCNDTIHIDYAPMKRQRVHEAEFDLSILEQTGVTARGRRLAPKPASKVRRIKTDENGGNGDDEKPVKDGEDVALPFD
jgi:topoisomerase-4 subunit A